MKAFISYFAISFVLQWVWFGIVHPNSGVTLLDMFVFSILFAVMFFFIGRIWHYQKKGRSE
ncbi:MULTISPECIES: hypothetical protein [Bacillus]|uniref:hypothetical protein n=1 Tax=Bacillus TaxID=1386 RepID=UPI0008201A4C|nr:MULTISPECIES: hypothetical protein [Bacillus]AOC58835.1 hypothetical protein BEN31_13585 [Bacillus pumilus]AZV55119.1 hypothetical protein DKE43_17155 [Bacillus pumilus]MBR0587892.1 hypothetical protein [Bacillus pumilus DW2J2]MBR0616957.1 hypothetical protein [Bacillus pumilus]MBR0622081.1 hypothetical protein [Bacillus pumilus]